MHRAPNASPPKMPVRFTPAAAGGNALALPAVGDKTMRTKMAAHCGGNGGPKMSSLAFGEACLGHIYRNQPAATCKRNTEKETLAGGCACVLLVRTFIIM